MSAGASVRQSATDFLASIDLTKRELAKAQAMALNKAADGVRVDTSRLIRSQFKGLKVSTVNKAFSIAKASGSNLVAVVKVRGRPLNLGNFGARQTRAGVTVMVKGQRKLIPHAFIVKVTTRDGESTFGVVFIRDAKNGKRPGRLPVKPLTSVDLPGLFSMKDVRALAMSSARDRFGVELDRALAAIRAGKSVS